MLSRKRKNLSVSEKMEIVKSLQNGKSNSDVCKEFSLSASSVSTIWKNRSSITEQYEENNLQTKKRRICREPQVDEALFKWFVERRSMSIPLNGPILQIQAEKLARDLDIENFECSRGWIDRFKKRHAISFGKISGEKNYVDHQDVTNWLEKWETIRQEYADEDIFNLDETGLFFNLAPDKTLRVKGENCAGGKLSKERVTLLVGANMCGTGKRKLLVIGKSKNPQCFKNVKTLPVKYANNQKSWITSDLWMNELNAWDAELCREKRKILLIVDNFAGHCAMPKLKNIRQEFFPPNVTSVLQPMDQGVIKSLKAHYRRKLVLNLLEKGHDKFKISLLEAIRLIAESWNIVSDKTIQNCFIKSGLKSKHFLK